MNHDIVHLSAIGIGARRCASSWLHNYLNEISAISKPKSGLHFFSEQYSKGEEWYLNELKLCNHSNFLLEMSVSYLYPEYNELAAQRIFKFNENIKLFAVLRNPLDRAYSDYLRSLANLSISKRISFSEAVKCNPLLLERGLYCKLLKPFYDLFPQEQIQLLFYDDLLHDKNLFLSNLFKFLEIDDVEEVEIWQEPKSRMVKYAFINKFIYSMKNNFDHFFYKKGDNHSWTIFKEKYMPFYNRIISMNTVGNKIAMDDLSMMKEYFYDDIKQLESICDRDLSNWLDINELEG